MASTTSGAVARWLDKPQDLYVTVAGIRIRYWDVGAGSRVLLIHGLATSVESWFSVIDVLATRHRVLALDLPGFGRSDKGEGSAGGFGPHFDAALIADFLRAIGVSRTALVGNSLGGLVALRVALGNPGLVERLVLVDSAGLGREVPPPLRLLSLPGLAEAMLYPSPPAAFVASAARLMLSSPQDQPSQFYERWAEMIAQQGAKAALLRTVRTTGNVFGQRPEQQVLDRLPEVRAPALVVWGSHDPLVPVAHGERAHRLLSGSRLHVFDGCQHCPQLERPAEFADLVLDFLESHPKTL